MNIQKRIFFKKGMDLCEFGAISECDVTEQYVNGLKEQKTYIENIPARITLETQKEYVKKIRLSKNDCILGLFVNNCLIGTAGAQNITQPDMITIGIFVFNQNNRGEGYGRILVWASTYILREVFGCFQFSAGVEKTNIPSLKSFESCGYHVGEETNDAYIMRLNAYHLIIPDYIFNVEIGSINKK